MNDEAGSRPLGVFEAVDKVGLETVQEELDYLNQRRKWRKSAEQNIPEGIAIEEMEVQGKRVIVMGRSNGEGIDPDYTGTFIWLDGPPT